MAKTVPIVFTALGKTLAVIPAFTVVFGLILFFVMRSSFDVLSPATLNVTTDTDTLRIDLDEATGKTLLWFGLSGLCAWGVSFIFVLIAALQKPAGASEERSLKWVWWLFLLSDIGLLIFITVRSFSSNALGYDLNSGFYVPLAAATVVVLLVLHWVTTTFAVPTRNGPSVPGYNLVPWLRGGA